jgi:hypothetical protein
MPAAAGRVHTSCDASDGRPMILRAAKWEGLDAMVGFADGLVEEQRKDPGFGTLIDGPVTREQEAKLLANKLVAIENGEEVSVVAEVSRLARGKLGSNGGDVGLHRQTRRSRNLCF